MRYLRWQCYHCNINCGGQGAVAYEKMLNEFGQEYLNEMKKDKYASVKAYDVYVEQLAKYKEIQ